MAKTFEEINDKIRRGEAVVVTAEEMVEITAEKGPKQAAMDVDVVTTGTFAPMCSSGAWLNTGHTKPRMKFQKAWLNDVPAYCGVAAVDLYIGASEVAKNDPLNSEFPGTFRYGGGHVIHDLVAGKDVKLEAVGHGTDCYPRKELVTWINLRDLNDAILQNPRNCYQNYNVAVNLSADRDIYTYMGVLKRNLGNANYSSAGQLSPLLNDPYYRTIGIGTRIFLGGGVGYVCWHGTQHCPTVERTAAGVPKSEAGTLSVIGDLKQMKPEWLVGVSLLGYGASLMVGVGVPIPILDEEMARFTAVSDNELVAPVIDYSRAYPHCEPGELGYVTYAELKSGEIVVQGKRVPTAPLSSYLRARQIAQTLKEWISDGQFLLGKPVELLPSADSKLTLKSLRERPVEDAGV